MGRQHRAGVKLTRYHSINAWTRDCTACKAVLEVRVSGKGYPGQDTDTVWFDCPACGAKDVVCIGMPDTGGADIRVRPFWRRFEGPDAAAERSILLVLAGVFTAVGVVSLAQRWPPRRSDVRLAVDMGIVGLIAAACLWVFNRPRVQTWIGYDEMRLNLVLFVMGLIVVGSIPLVVLTLN